MPTQKLQRLKQRANRRFILVSEKHPNQQSSIDKVVEYSNSEIDLSPGMVTLSRIIAARYLRLHFYSTRAAHTVEQVEKAVSESLPNQTVDQAVEACFH